MGNLRQAKSDTEDFSAEGMLVKMSSPQRLKAIFEYVAEEYRQRICDMYEWYVNETFWVNDEVGSTLIVNDIQYAIPFDDVRLMVDNEINEETFINWWTFNDGCDHPINIRSWLKGMRNVKS